MRVIDIDPELLRLSARAAMHAGVEGTRHVGFEIEGNVENILTTLAPQGPYGFTVRQQMLPDGTLKMQVQTKFEEIREEYQITRDMCDVHTHTPLIDIRASWYLFQEVVNTGSLRGSDRINTNETLVLLPVATGGGLLAKFSGIAFPRRPSVAAPCRPIRLPVPVNCAFVTSRSMTSFSRLCDRETSRAC